MHRRFPGQGRYRPARNAASNRRVPLRLAHTYSLPWSCRTFSLGVLAVSGMPSHLPPHKRDQSKAPSLRRVVLRAFTGTADLSDSLPAPRDFSHPALYARSLPDEAAGEGLSCSALLCPNVPPPPTPGRSSIRSGLECCLSPSPRHERLGPPKHLSADNPTSLLRSLIVAARRFAPLSFKGFRHSARLGRISPPGWCLLPGAPALTRTGLSPARTSRLSGRTMTSPCTTLATVERASGRQRRHSCRRNGMLWGIMFQWSVFHS